MQMADTGVI